MVRDGRQCHYNIGIIDEIPDKCLELPLYYVCDWDYDGLWIYSAVKTKLNAKSKTIVLIQPDDLTLALPVDSVHRNSEWIREQKFSGLNQKDFSEKQKELISYLISNNLWIEKESFENPA